VTVVVPVLRRPQNAAPFMSSLTRTTPGATALVITNAEGDHETVRAWGDAGAYVWPCHEQPGSFAQKANVALPYVMTEWFLLVGDDVRFHPDWLPAALAVAEAFGAKVIGTNDGVRPEVQRGETAVHFLINTEHAREVGCSWDGPGKVCHEGYRHWFTDNELLAKATQDDVWAPATASLIEHRHPFFGGAEMDDVYQIGLDHRQQDAELFEQRLRRFAPELIPQPQEATT
jgi:hypothetical protein